MSICLIVEDSEIIREIAARIVQNLGLEAVDADGAGPALERCRAESVAVVLLDWDLPAMGALDFLRGAAALDEAARPEIIL